MRKMSICNILVIFATIFVAYQQVQAACYVNEYGESCCHTSSSDGLLLDRGLQCTGNICTYFLDILYLAQNTYFYENT